MLSKICNGKLRFGYFHLSKEDKGSDKFDGPKEHSKEYEIA